ncbi:MAG: AMP-binding protein [Alphaproteobacteria bacterium]|nr:AMP-binding protein [Alphaproteobacteria bacterium]
MQNFIRFWLRFALRLLKVQVSFDVAPENLPQKAIYISNHASWLDPIILFAYLPNSPFFLLHPRLYRNKWIKFFLGHAHKTEFNYMDPANIKKVIQLVNHDRSIVMFPEGMMTDNGDMMKIYEAPVIVADRTDAPFIPIWISGAEFSPFSETSGTVPHRPFPKIRVKVSKPQKIIVNEVLKKNRDYLKDQTYMMLNNLRFEARFRNNVALFKKLVRTSKLYGKTSVFERREIIEDIKRVPQTYMDIIIKSHILGAKFALITDDKENVGVILPNSIENVVTFFGLSAYNRIPVMLNFSLGPKIVASMCKTALVRQVITAKSFVEKAKLQETIETLQKEGIKICFLEDIAASITLKDKIKAYFAYKTKRVPVEQNPQDPAVILFTSGSDGAPKAVVLSHSNIFSNVVQTTCVAQLNLQDLLFNALPMFHSFGLTIGTLFPLLTGATVFLFPSPLQYRTITELLYELKVTMMIATDTFYKVYARLSHPYDFRKIRLCIAGAEGVKDETRNLMAERLGVILLEGYGTTECSPLLTINTLLFNKYGTLGKLVPGIEYRLDDVEGLDDAKELVVKGPNIMMGYILPENPGVLVPVKDGWYHTGDVVTVDDLGFIKLVDRVKRFAKIGGEMISLTAVENNTKEICPYEDFKCVAVALPHPKKGEQIVLVSNNADLTRKDFIDFVTKNGLSELYVPSVLLYKEEFPVFATGKADKITLKKWAAEQIEM